MTIIIYCSVFVCVYLPFHHATCYTTVPLLYTFRHFSYLHYLTLSTPSLFVTSSALTKMEWNRWRNTLCHTYLLQDIPSFPFYLAILHSSSTDSTKSSISSFYPSLPFSASLFLPFLVHALRFLPILSIFHASFFNCSLFYSYSYFSSSSHLFLS